MERFSSDQADYAFGQAMLTLRTSIGLTQAALAEFLGVSRRAVVTWEGGSRYPTSEHLKKYIELAVQQRALPAGREDGEIRFLWRASHQKVLLDEAWLDALLRQSQAPHNGPRAQREPPVPVTDHRPLTTDNYPRLDWGDALSVSSFYGRAWELDLMAQWTVKDRCRVVSVLGLGGIGKSALAVNLMRWVAAQFDVVIWRSLRDAPTIEALLDDCLQVLAPQALGAGGERSESPGPPTGEGRLHTLLEYMRHTRLLLVLDNLETVLEEGTGTGQMRAGYEGFSRLLRLVAETEHQSCLIFTSREKPADLGPLEGSGGGSPVRVLRLAPLEADACEALLAEKEVKGSTAELARLIDAYAGNPLALKIVAQTILDLFGGELGPFLAQGEIIFGGVRDLLARQFNRLSPLEQCIMIWLAILREPAGLEDVQAVLATPLPRARMLEAVEALHRRSLIERSNQPGRFTLPSVVLEYVIARLITDVSREVQQGRLDRLIEYGLELAQAPDYVRQTQERLIVAPILTELRTAYPNQAAIGEQLLALLAQLRTLAPEAQGYGPANLLALLREGRGDLRGLDLGGLALRGVYLQGVEMQDADLSGALLRDTVFTEAFDAIMSVAVSSTGAYWAACSRRGEVWIWEALGLTLNRIAEVDTHTIFRLAFSPDGEALAGGGWDGEVVLWASAGGALLWSSGPDARMGMVNSVAFAPDGRRIASSGENGIVELRERGNGALLQTLPHPAVVPVVTLSPDGRLLASGDVEGVIRLWAVGEVGVETPGDASVRENKPATCLQTLKGHTQVLAGLAFSPDGHTLASASLDGTVKLWVVRGPSGVASGAPEETPYHIEALHLRQTLSGHTSSVTRVAWSPDGRTLASAGWDQTVLLWDTQKGGYRAVLRGHSAAVRGLAFTPDSQNLISGSEDGTIRVWDMAGGQCMRVMQGYTASLETVDWSPDGGQLVGGGTDEQVTVYTIEGTGSPPGRAAPRGLRGHRGPVYGLGWSPALRGRVASSEWDNSIRLWDPGSGNCVQVLQHPEDGGNSFIDVAWSPDGKRLAAGTRRYGVMMWDVPAQHWVWPGQIFPTSISGRVAWSPEGARLGAAGGDGAVYVWDAASTESMLLQRLGGHPSLVVSLAWSPDGRVLAAGSGGPEGGEVAVWDVQRGERLYTLARHPGIVNGLAWGVDPDLIVTGSSDGRLRWWNVASGECLWVREGHQRGVQSLRRSPDGRMVASGGEDGAIMLWDIVTGEHLQTLRRERPYERLNITGIRGITEAQKATLRALGAVEGNIRSSKIG